MNESYVKKIAKQVRSDVKFKSTQNASSQLKSLAIKRQNWLLYILVSVGLIKMVWRKKLKMQTY